MRGALLALALVVAGLGPAQAQTPARDLFSAAGAPSAGSAAPIGSYARGCMAGGFALPIDGPGWQAMRLSRNRNYGHPNLVRFIEWLSDAARTDGWAGLLVGDMSQPRGGPMNGGHASHQIGLDVDLWLTPSPGRTLSRDERESLGATSMIRSGTRTVDPSIWGMGQAMLIYRAANHADVARIFVHPGIKQALCEINWRDRSFLNKVRPWWGHDSHFHVRLSCPAGAAGCVDQDPPPAGDGCGADLDYWLSDEPWRPADPPARPTPPLTLADLPNACRQVLAD